MPQRPDLEEFHKQLAETIQKESQKILDVRQELLKNYPMLDSDGYPTDECLQIIKNWHWSDPKGWFNFIKEHWWAPDFGWREVDEPHEYRENREVHRYYLSTGGWSGNETLIWTMEQNRPIWSVHWVQSRRGGHYIFEIENRSEQHS